MKQDVLKLVKSGLEKIPELEEFLDEETIEKAVERTKDNKHGDFTSNIAMRFAKLMKKNPRDLAEQLVRMIPNNNLVNKINIAGPGFINFHLSDDSFHNEIINVIRNNSI